MSLHPLHLAPDPAPDPAPACAFWVTVPDPAAWAEGLRRLGPGARAFVLPRAEGDLRPGGAVLVPAQPCEAGLLPWPACARLWGRVWVPAGWRVEPALTLSEARRLFPCETAFFHPLLGPVGFAEADACLLADLLAAPARRPLDPTWAREGAPPLPALGNMALRTMPGLADLFGKGGEGIGEQKPEALDPLNNPQAPLGEKARELWLRAQDGLRGDWWQSPRFRRIFWWTLAGLALAFVVALLIWMNTGNPAAHPHPPVRPHAPTPHPATPPPAAPPGQAAPPAAPGTDWGAVFGWATLLLSLGLGLMLALLWGRFLLPIFKGLMGFWKVILVALAVIAGVALLAWVFSEAKSFPVAVLILPLVLLARFFTSKLAGASGGTAWSAAPAPAAAPKPVDVQGARDREINRLLDLLEKNPEEGLRYALPLGGSHAGRGLAPLSTALGRHGLGFTLGSGGGVPTDTWRLRAEQEWQLQRKYREQANRAIAEGKHERAAYILANLLSDWPAAASALEQGGLWQKAAQIHEEKSRDLFNAARCLEKAGLLEDAAVRYEKTFRHGKAGDLWHQLGRRDRAGAAWRKAVAQARTAREKARILFEKLGDHEAALALLETAWPSSPEAAACLELQLDYLARLGRHEARLAIYRRLRRDPAARLRPPERMMALLRDRWRGETHAGAKAEAESAAWQTAGEALSGAGAGRPEAREILGTLPAFAPKDRLLSEDARRFLARGTDAPKATPRAGGNLVVTESGDGARFTNEAIQWQDMMLTGGELVVMGWNAQSRQYSLTRFRKKTGQLEHPDWSISPYELVSGLPASARILEWNDAASRGMLIDNAFRSLFFHPDASAAAGDIHRLAWLAGAHAVAVQADQTLFAVVPAASGAVEVKVWRKGRQVAAHTLALGQWPEGHPIPACARDDAFYFAIGPLLVRCRATEGFDPDKDVADMGEPIAGLAAAPAPFPHRLLVAAGPRAVLVEPPKGFAMEELHTDPHGDLLGALFTRDGHAIPVGRFGAPVFRAGESVEKAGRLSAVFAEGTRFAALLPLDEPASFAYLTRDGHFGACRPA